MGPDMDEVRLAYQPVVDLDDGRIVGYEALARFGTGDEAPGPWLDAADQAGHRAELEALLVQQVLDARAKAPPDVFLAVNVTPEFLFHGPVWRTLTGAGDLHGLVVELTEHQPVADLGQLRQRMDAIRDGGCAFALDDVGAGWSGLQQVIELKPDIVKLDRSIVTRLHEDPARSAVTELLGGFTDRLGGTLLAEGVENCEELSALLQLDVHWGQGFLLGRPQFGWPDVPADAAELLTHHNRQERQVGQLAHPISDRVEAPRPLAEEVRTTLLPTIDVEACKCGTRDSDERPAMSPQPLFCVPMTCTPRAALCRAMERPSEARLDPVACTDSSGQVIAMVTVDALVRTLVAPSLNVG
jgi:EAL domain-containing protein (putative c-di-GMP-specific phosphodiesterase class I)